MSLLRSRTQGDEGCPCKEAQGGGHANAAPASSVMSCPFVAVGTSVSSRAHRVTGAGHPPPVPTERSVRFSRTTLFGSWFAAPREPVAAGKGGTALVAVTEFVSCSD